MFRSWASGERQQVWVPLMAAQWVSAGQASPAFLAFPLGFLRHLQFVSGSKDDDFKLVWSMNTSILSPHLVRPTVSLLPWLRRELWHGSAVHASFYRLQSLHPPSQGFDLGSQVGQSRAVSLNLQQTSMAKCGVSEACLLTSHLRHLNYIISLDVKNHCQNACDLSVPETTRVWAGCFFFFPSLQKCVKDIIYYNETVNVQNKTDMSSFQMPLCLEDWK